MKQPSEPVVPLSVFNEMFGTMVQLFEREAEARREHERRIVDAITSALAPAPVPLMPVGPMHVSEVDEDLAFARGSGDEALIKQLEQEIEFSRPIAKQFET